MPYVHHELFNIELPEENAAQWDALLRRIVDRRGDFTLHYIEALQSMPKCRPDITIEGGLYLGSCNVHMYDEDRSYDLYHHRLFRDKLGFYGSIAVLYTGYEDQITVHDVVRGKPVAIELFGRETSCGLIEDKWFSELGTCLAKHKSPISICEIERGQEEVA